MRLAAASLCALVTSIMAVAAGATPRAGHTDTYADPVGDAGCGQAPTPLAPDITQVTVTDDGAGSYTFRVLIPNRPAPPPSDTAGVELSINTDKNYSTGRPSSGGSEFFLHADHKGGTLTAYQGTNVDVTPPTMRYSWSNGPSWTVRAADLGGTTAFFFIVIALETDKSVSPPVFCSDWAPPNDHGFVFPKAQPKPKPLSCKSTQKPVVVDGKTKCVPKAKKR